jgi:hypothetical protein
VRREKRRVFSVPVSQNYTIMGYAIEPFSVLSNLAGSSLEKPLLAEPGAEMLEAYKVAD